MLISSSSLFELYCIRLMTKLTVVPGSPFSKLLTSDTFFPSIFSSPIVIILSPIFSPDLSAGKSL